MRKVNKKTKEQLIRYILISLFGYAFVFSGLYILVTVLNINESISFMLIYGLSYLMLYMLQLKFLFRTKHTNRRLFKFLISIAAFYIISNVIFNIGIYFELHYLIATVFTIGVLFPIRFIVSKFIIFKS